MYPGVPSWLPVSVSAACDAGRGVRLRAIPKSTTLTPPSAAEQHVLRLEIAMDDAARVGGVERLRDLEADVDQARGGQRAGGEDRAQRRAADELAGDEEIAVDVLERIDGRDRGMRERGRGARFALEALARLAVAAERGRQRLERDLAAEPLVFRGIDDAHAAPADFFVNPVRTDAAARERRVGGGVGEQLRRHRPGRLLEKSAGGVVRAKERADFGGDVGMRGVLARQEPLALAAPAAPAPRRRAR